MAYREAIQMWKTEKAKGKEGLSVRKVAQLVGDKYNVSIAASTLCKKGNSGNNDVEIQGANGKHFTKEEYDVLKSAFSTSVSLQQISK